MVPHSKGCHRINRVESLGPRAGYTVGADEVVELLHLEGDAFVTTESQRGSSSRLGLSIFLVFCVTGDK